MRSGPTVIGERDQRFSCARRPRPGAGTPRTTVLTLAALWTLNAVSGAACGQCEEWEFLASDGAPDDWLGYSVCLSGPTAIVGAPYHDHPASDCGAAFIVERDPGGLGNWAEVAELLAFDAEPGDKLGLAVAISGDVAVAGAVGDQNHTGSAYVFHRDHGGPGNWGMIAKLTTSDGAMEDRFGISVAADLDTIVIGADRHNTNDAGAAYLFRRDQGGPNNWGQVTKITASDGGPQDYFGRAVTVSGDIVIVGAFKDGPGSAYVFYRDQGGPNNWGQVAKITASDGQPDDNFGGAVSLEGDTLIVGAEWDDHAGGTHAGAAYVFQRDHGGTNNWGEIIKLTAFDAEPDDLFGSTVSVHGDLAVVGAYLEDGPYGDVGAAYVYERNLGGPNLWGRRVKLTPFDGTSDNEFGNSVCISNDIVAIGAFRDSDNGSEAGSAYFVNIDGPDCNENGICDTVDLLNGTSEDCNLNEVPDECDIASGFSEDCNTNNVPDECDIASGFSEDCNLNDVPDECDIASGFSEDCNTNNVPDECDIAGGFSHDWNGNGVPDECECLTDVNGDGVTNVVDLLTLLVMWGPCAACPADVNCDGVVDVLDLMEVFSAWGPCP